MRIGEYEVISEIARGGMGVVYRARRAGDPRVVALKVLLEEKDPTDVLVRRFDREIRTGQALDHPGIVKVFDSGKAEGRLYFTMELVDGVSLDKLLPRLELREKIEILERVARAVDHAHARGWIHRDLKPQNILVTADRQPKIADFGLARSVARQSRLTKTGSVLGTPHYMPPEQADGSVDLVDQRSDVYSLGAMLYEALAGAPPFTAPTQLALLTRILNDEPEDPRKLSPECPRELSIVALKALEKGRDARFQTARELADELAAWLQGKRISTGERGRVATVFRVAKRHKLASLSVVVLAMTASVTVGLVVASRKRDEDSRKEQARSALRDAEEALQALAGAGPIASLREKLEQARNGLENAGPGEAGNEEVRRALDGAIFVARGNEPPDLGLDRLEGALRAALGRANRSEIRSALAQTLEKKGSPEAAIAVLEEAKAPPPALLERLGRLRLDVDDAPGAREALERAVAGDPALASARFLLVRALSRAGEAAKALELAKKLEDERPNDDETALALALALLPGDPGRAAFVLRRVEAHALRGTEPAHASALVRTGRILIDAGRVQEAILPLDRAVELSPRDPVPLLARADARIFSGDREGAIKDLALASERAAPGSFLRARAKEREAFARSIGEEAAARSVAARALEERPQDLGLQLAVLAGFATTDEERRRDEGKLAALARSLGRRREAARAWAALSRWLGTRKDSQGALDAARRSMEVHANAEARFALADALAESGTGDARAAREEAEKVFVEGDDDGARLVRESRIAAKLAKRFPKSGELMRAVALAKESADAAPWAGAPLFQQASLLAEFGDRIKAGPGDRRLLLQRGLQCAGDDPRGLLLLAELELEEGSNGLHPQSDLVARAEKLAGRCLAKEPGNARALAVRGRCHFLREDATRAVLDLDASLRLSKYEARVWSWKADALRVLGRTDEASRADKEAQERGPLKDEIVKKTCATARALHYNFDAITGDQEPLIAALRRIVDLDPFNPDANYLLGFHLFSYSADRREGEDQWVLMGRALARAPQCLDELDEGVIKILANVSSTTEENVARLESEWENARGFEGLWTAGTIRSLNLLRYPGAEPRKDVDAVRLAIERCLAQDPAEAFAAHGALAWLWALEDEPELARWHGQRFLTLFPKNGRFCIGLALAEAKANHGDKAREWLEQALTVKNLGYLVAKYHELQALR